MLPSFGSTSRPADVPHLRPAGSSPQLRVTFGAGFGSPSPVTGLGAFDCVWVVKTNAAPNPSDARRILDVVIFSPVGLLACWPVRASLRRLHARCRACPLQNPPLHSTAVAG